MSRTLLFLLHKNKLTEEKVCGYCSQFYQLIIFESIVIHHARLFCAVFDSVQTKIIFKIALSFRVRVGILRLIIGIFRIWVGRIPAGRIGHRQNFLECIGQSLIFLFLYQMNRGACLAVFTNPLGILHGQADAAATLTAIQTIAIIFSFILELFPIINHITYIIFLWIR